ncbi:SDR family NAD(P)-dependent oxidoreductase, partial [Francisella tularensis subsp. holarctica]|uniref:SDR family oxidoreductase n=1 Tax=Francisella tularensis TaxID=263 RepID=UPI002381CC02
VVISGSISGIGAAIAIRCYEAWHSLLLVGRRVDKIEELNLPNTLIRKVDVTDSHALKNAIKEAEAQYGPVDCLVINAGLMLLGQID